MTYKEYKNAEEYKSADRVDIYDETGEEFPVKYPENVLERMEVVETHDCEGWLSVTLKDLEK